MFLNTKNMKWSLQKMELKGWKNSKKKNMRLSYVI